MSTNPAVEMSNTTEVKEVTYALRHKPSGLYVKNNAMGFCELNDCESNDVTALFEYDWFPPARIWQNRDSLIHTTTKGHARTKTLADAVRFIVDALNEEDQLEDIEAGTLKYSDFELLKIESTHLITVEPVE